MIGLIGVDAERDAVADILADGWDFDIVRFCDGAAQLHTTLGLAEDITTASVMLAVRGILGDDIWTHHTFDSGVLTWKSRVVIPDLTTPNEALATVEAGGELWRIVGLDAPDGPLAQQPVHRSILYDEDTETLTLRVARNLDHLNQQTPPRLIPIVFEAT